MGSRREVRSHQTEDMCLTRLAARWNVKSERKESRGGSQVGGRDRQVDSKVFSLNNQKAEIAVY